MDAVLVHQGPIDDQTVARYEAEGAHPLTWPETSGADVPVYRRNLLAREHKIRHDPMLTVEAVVEAWREARAMEQAQ